MPFGYDMEAVALGIGSLEEEQAGGPADEEDGSTTTPAGQ